MKTKEIITTAIILIMSITITIAFVSDAGSDSELERQQYCHMVDLWEYDQAKGIEPFERRGHPNYNEVSCK